MFEPAAANREYIHTGTFAKVMEKEAEPKSQLELDFDYIYGPAARENSEEHYYEQVESVTSVMPAVVNTSPSPNRRPSMESIKRRLSFKRQASTTASSESKSHQRRSIFQLAFSRKHATSASDSEE